MRRIDSSTSSPTELDVPDKTDAGASPPKAQAQSAPKEKPGGSGESHVSRQSEAEARAAQSTGAEQAVGVATEALTRSFDNLVINEKDAQRALDALGGLSSEQFKAAVNELASNGMLERLGDNMDADQRGAFLELARKKGLVELDPPTEVPKGAANPPAPARLYDNDPRLPTAMRDIIHAENIDRAYSYFGEYRAYQDRYIAEVGKAKDAADLRQLSAAAEPSIPHESFYYGDPGTSRYSDDWLNVTRRAPTITSTSRAISDRTEDFKDQDRTGSFALYAKAEPKLEGKFGSTTVAVEGEAQAKLRDYGRVTHKESLKASVSSHLQKGSVEVEREHKKTSAKGEVELKGGPIGAKASFSASEEKALETRNRMTVDLLPEGGISKGIEVDGQGKVGEVTGFDLGSLGLKVKREIVDDGHSRTTSDEVEIPYLGEWKQKRTVMDGAEETDEWSLKTKGPIGVSADSKGNMAVSVSAVDSLKGVGRANYKEGTFGGGVKFGAKGVEAEVGLELQGLRRETADEISKDLLTGRDESIHSKWPELDQGVAWNRLSPEALARAKRNGFDSASWAKAIRHQSNHR